jgi:hypothetical protein
MMRDNSRPAGPARRGVGAASALDKLVVARTSSWPTGQDDRARATLIDGALEAEFSVDLDAQFGSVAIDGETITHDVIIRLGGRVEKRKKKLSKAAYGASHTIAAQSLHPPRHAGPLLGPFIGWAPDPVHVRPLALLRQAGPGLRRLAAGCALWR